eukprot:s3587_g12.t1
MSNGLKIELAALSKKADRLQVEVVELAESIAALSTPGLFGDWVLVDDSFPPLPQQEFTALQTLQRFYGLEDGCPTLPEELLRVAARALTFSPEEILEKAHSAYSAGFFAKISLATETEYERQSRLTDEGKCHWVIFYRHSPNANRRVSSRKCLEVAISVEKDCIWEGFATVTELLIFCAGASSDAAEGVQTYALPIMSRPGGALYAIPDKVLSSNLLLDAMISDEVGILGPSREFSA